MAKKKVEVKAHRRKDGSIVQGHTREVETSATEIRAGEVRGTLGAPVVGKMPEMPPLPEGWEEWKPVQDGTVPQYSTPDSMMSVLDLVDKGAASAEIAENRKHTDPRATNYAVSGTNCLGLTYREGNKIHLTGYGKELANMSTDEKHATLGNMLANTDEVWLSHAERERAWEAQGHNLHGQTLNERNKNFDNWRKLAENAVRDNTDSPEDADRFIEERKRHAEANSRVHKPVNTRIVKGDPLSRKANEVHCQECFMLVVPGRGCDEGNPKCPVN